MFKKTRSNAIKDYKILLKKILVDKVIADEIIYNIDRFEEDGQIFMDGQNLYGKKTAKNDKDYLEIRIDNNTINCIYTEWDLKMTVVISQMEMNNKQKRVSREETGNIKFSKFSDMNEQTTEKDEKIYNSENRLIYKCVSKQNETYNNSLISIRYKDSIFSNTSEVDKEWYIYNGTIIKYKLAKNLLSEELVELYLICPEALRECNINTYVFNELDKNLFIDFMTGKITIDEVLKQNEEEAIKTAKTFYKNHSVTEF